MRNFPSLPSILVLIWLRERSPDLVPFSSTRSVRLKRQERVFIIYLFISIPMILYF